MFNTVQCPKGEGGGNEVAGAATGAASQLVLQPLQPSRQSQPPPTGTTAAAATGTVPAPLAGTAIAAAPAPAPGPAAGIVAEPND